MAGRAWRLRKFNWSHRSILIYVERKREEDMLAQQIQLKNLAHVFSRKTRENLRTVETLAKRNNTPLQGLG